MPHLESVALGVWIKSGSRNETVEEHGIAHLLEHMAFKGTARRTARQIAEEIENVGGEVQRRHLHRDHLLLRPRSEGPCSARGRYSRRHPHRIELRRRRAAREKHVILQEIGAANDVPDDVVFDRFAETAFRGQTIGRPILGTPDTVNSFTPAQIRGYLGRNYTTDRLFVVAAGAVDHDSFVKQVEERFASIPTTPTATPILETAIYTGGETREERDLMDAQVLLGFEGKAYHAATSTVRRSSPTSSAAACRPPVPGSARASWPLLFGLCLPLGLFRHRHFRRACGHRRGKPAGTDARHHRGLRKSSDKIEQQEIDRARAQIRAQLLMGQESPAARAGQIARQMMLYGRPIPNEELMERLSGITIERLTDLAGRLFFDATPTCRPSARWSFWHRRPRLRLACRSARPGSRGRLRRAAAAPLSGLCPSTLAWRPSAPAPFVSAGSAVSWLIGLRCRRYTV